MSQLDLHITVEGNDPDGTLAQIIAQGPKHRPHLALLVYGTRNLGITKIERADGQPIGAEAEFEQYWEESHVEDNNTEAWIRNEAHDAFMHGITYANRIR